MLGDELLRDRFHNLSVCESAADRGINYAVFSSFNVAGRRREILIGIDRYCQVIPTKLFVSDQCRKSVPRGNRCLIDSLV